MARFQRLEVLSEIIRIGVVPVFHCSDLEVAKKIVAACAAGGARVVEFTNRGDNAYRILSDLVQYFSNADPSVILGVGSVLDPATAALYISSGANFVVGPVFNPEVAKVCNRRKVAYIPGCGSVSEISEAEEWGVEIVKVFPGDAVGGPAFVKAILGPCPWTRIMPTGGVEATRESISAWFQAGVAAIGIGSHLIRKDWVEACDFAAITALTAQLIAWIREVRDGLLHGILV
ncbi:MAG: bifunctional 4-hydroxy-2-oxoglutarate aldolase/2-dehydro-3-deoxy-phosphogluconate aldolase [Anaerolineae bacterium]